MRVSSRAFPTTQWSLIASLQTQGEDARAAAAVLAERYWAPVYAYLIGRGLSPEAASDMTQSFFADVVLGRGLFERARPESGRLRGLVLAALRNYVIDRHRNAKARFDSSTLPLDAAEQQILRPLAGLDPDDAFNKRWALALFNEALSRCEQHFSRPALARNWAAFEAWIIRPGSGPNAPTVAQLASRLGFRSAHDFRAAVQTVKKRVLSVLRDVVLEQVASGEDSRVEYQEVLALLK